MKLLFRSHRRGVPVVGAVKVWNDAGHALLDRDLHLLLASSSLFPFTVTLVEPPDTESLIAGKKRTSSACNGIRGDVKRFIPGAVTVIL